LWIQSRIAPGEPVDHGDRRAATLVRLWANAHEIDQEEGKPRYVPMAADGHQDSIDAILACLNP